MSRGQSRRELSQGWCSRSCGPRVQLVPPEHLGGARAQACHVETTQRVCLEPGSPWTEVVGLVATLAHTAALPPPLARHHGVTVPQVRNGAEKTSPSSPAPAGTGLGVPQGQAGSRSESCWESPQGLAPPNPRRFGVWSPERGAGWARSRGA